MSFVVSCTGAKKSKRILPPPVTTVHIPLTKLFDFRNSKLMYPLQLSGSGVAGTSVKCDVIGRQLEELNIYVAVSGGQLMTPQLLHELNPMCVTVRGVSSLPAKPLSYKDLSEQLVLSLLSPHCMADQHC